MGKMRIMGGHRFHGACALPGASLGPTRWWNELALAPRSYILAYTAHPGRQVIHKSEIKTFQLSQLRASVHF